MDWEQEKKDGILSKEENGLQLSCEIEDVVNYAIQQNGIPIIREVCVKNTSEEDIDCLVIKIDSNDGWMEPSQMGIQKLKAGEERHLKKFEVSLDGTYLASLTERIVSKIRVRACLGEKTLALEAKEITVLAFDQWPGLLYTPELLVAFSMPNHPVTASLLQMASKYLDKWIHEPALAGYQFDDPNHVKTMAAAVYAAIQQKNITYAEPPSHFEAFGQRIRLADAVLDQHMGTCMDLTLLYVACLEAMGLNPIMVMTRGHIFGGVWLMEDSFPDMIMEDPSQLEKRMSKGIHEMIVVECTAMCAGKTLSFDEAVTIAERNVSNYKEFLFAIDVRRARSMGIRPLPVRIKTNDGFEVRHEERREKEITRAPQEVGITFDFQHPQEKEKVTKQVQWERKLLDMSMRNMLINLRMTKSVVPLLSSDISILEDALADGEEFQVLARPADMVVSGSGVQVEELSELGAFAEFLALESRHRRLHSVYTEGELGSCLTKIYRSAKSSMEENGASTLYLALGMLRWVEGKRKASVRYAPIVLLPIEIRRKPGGKGYTMRMRDEDAQINITLLEFLKQNFDLQIYGLQPPPTDEHGLDIPKIFAIVRRAVMNFPMWDVVEVGVIGNFSFSQFVMWNDIHSRADFLERNKIVRSLMYGAVEWDCAIPESVESDEAYLPVTADASQLRAINMAAAGVSFVLHGPPGTGKSQTITAMIANALTRGKRVLFVAEKMAALEVVKKRLAALGIQNFCLELHSNKATKKAVLDQLKTGLEMGVWGSPTDYERKIGQIRQMRTKLDAYVQSLHRERDFGKSLRELIDLYETIPETGKNLWFDRGYAASLRESDLQDQIRRLERLIAAAKAIGHPCNHPLRAVHQREYTQRLKFELEEMVLAYKGKLEQICDDMNCFAEKMDLEKPVTEKQWNDIMDYARSVIVAEEIPTFLVNAKSIDEEFSIPASYMKKRDAFVAEKEKFLKLWNESFLHMDMNPYRAKYDQANKKFFGKKRALAALTSEMQSFAFFLVETERIPVYLTDITFYQQKADEMKTLESQLPYRWKTLLEKYPTQETLLEYQQDIKRQLAMIDQFSEKMRRMEEEKTLEDCIQKAKKLLADFEEVCRREDELDDLLELSFEDEGEDWIAVRERLCDCLLQNASSLKDWIFYGKLAKECREKGLAPICDVYEEGLPHEEVMDTYLRSIYRAMILSVIERDPVLNGFTGTDFNARIEQFKKLDEEFMELTKDEMYYKLTHQLPTNYESVQISKELNILRRAISNNGRGISIRSLFDQIPHILQRLCPCMLMSPISVAQYLAAKNDQFDIVIFDEASQLPTCKAVGVLARGRNAVIVGDPNQMPPTSFFAGNTVDEENLDIEDLDSILDDCLALGMPQTHLYWHYRSRHESLIAFSNREFYENSMMTFPSVNDREKRVRLVKTEGFFERGKRRVNEGEARAIVQEIKRRYHSCTDETVGVVTFNISQQTLIEDLLQEECQSNPAFDRWANEKEEPLFVKNLENVQGDERDVILFSVAFGPDEEGRLSLNFGPLNKEGGWKRLNVAVSRARAEMVVFTTMTADMIDLKRTKSKGVEALKHFLEFAENGRIQGTDTPTKVQKNQGILEHLCQKIADAGYEYQTGVGHSQFKVDIAVINPYNEEEYLLGIMLDGDSYRRSANTKDREVSQISVLQRLGWKLHRVWTMDWWDNREKEIAKLFDVLSKCRGDAYEAYLDVCQISSAVQDENIGQEVNTLKNRGIELVPCMAETEYKTAANTLEKRSESPQVLRESPRYQMEPYLSAAVKVTPLSTANYASKEWMTAVTEKLQQIIDAESPISYERLVKKTLRAFDISRSSTQTIEATQRALKKTISKVEMQGKTEFYWSDGKDPDSYWIYRMDAKSDDRRSPDEICEQELKNAVCITLQRKGVLDRDALFRETIRTMGYARSGTALAAAVERGLEYGKKTGEIVENQNQCFRLKEKL